MHINHFQSHALHADLLRLLLSIHGVYFLLYVHVYHSLTESRFLHVDRNMGTRYRVVLLWF